MNNLAKIRKVCGYTQRQLAEMSGLSARTIQYVESKQDNNSVSAKIKFRISAALRCPADAISDDIICDNWISELTKHKNMEYEYCENDLRNSINTLQEIATSLSQEIQTLRKEVSDLKSTKLDIKKDLQTLRKEVSDLKSIKSDIEKIAKHFT